LCLAAYQYELQFVELLLGGILPTEARSKLNLFDDGIQSGVEVER
jgi:hypothetical protein